MEIYKKIINAFARKYLKPNYRTLDIGCGDGMHTRILTNYSEHVTGADLDNRLLKNNKIKFKKVTPYNYGNEKFDFVTSFDVIEHVEDDLRFMKAIKKVCNKNAIVIIGTPNRFRVANILLALVRGGLKYPRNLGYHFESGGDIIHLREYTLKELSKVAQKSGFKIIELSGFSIGIYTPIGFIGIPQKTIFPFNLISQHLFVVCMAE